MKSLLFTFCFIGCFSAVLSQTNKFTFGLEYSPNFSNITQEHFQFYTGEVGGLRFSNNIFLKGGYQLLPKLYATAGIGILETRELITVELSNYMEIAKAEADFFHYYIVVPVGITYHLGSFYINPEVGIGWNIDNRVEIQVYNTDGSQREDSDRRNRNGNTNTTFPVLLSIGHEIKIDKVSILLGIKGYYSIKPQGENFYEKWHYYGFGFVTGVRF